MRVFIMEPAEPCVKRCDSVTDSTNSIKTVTTKMKDY